MNMWPMKLDLILAHSAERALGSVAEKVKICRDIGTSAQLYDACVSPYWPVMREYGHFKSVKCQILFLGFLGVHKLASPSAAQGDIGWVPETV